MICPHCNKPVPRGLTPEAKRKAIELSKEGYSTRDIQSILGGVISFSSVARLLKLEKSKKL